MKRALYVLLAVNLLWVAISLLGVITDAQRLDLWTQHLLVSLLATLVVLPALLFTAIQSRRGASEPPQGSHHRPETSESPQARSGSPLSQKKESHASAASAGSAASEGRAAPRHARPEPPPVPPLRRFFYAVGGMLALAALVSFLALFLSVATELWTEVLLWSLIGLVVWAPVAVLWPTAPPPHRTAPTAPDTVPPFVEPHRSSTEARGQKATDQGNAETGHASAPESSWPTGGQRVSSKHTLPPSSQVSPKSNAASPPSWLQWPDGP